MIELDFEHEKSDWVRTIRRVTGRLPAAKVGYVVIGLGTLLGIATMSWGLLVVEVVAVALIWTTPTRVWRRVPAAHGPQHVELTDEGIVHVTPLASSRTSWAVFDRLIETGDALVLVQQRRLVSVLPKSAFASDAQLAEARALITRNLHR
jgi:hypothetical protein